MFARKPFVRPPRPPLVRMEGCRGTYSTAGLAAVPKVVPLRSESYRRFVASQECFLCRLEGFSQCAHENLGKALQGKVCDSRTWPGCGPHHGLVGCHAQFDLGLDGLTRDERRDMGSRLSAQMRERATAAGWRFTSTEILKP